MHISAIMLIFAKSNDRKAVFQTFKNQTSMANIEKKDVDTRTFPEICASISNAEWLAIRDRIIEQTRKSTSAIYYWRDGKTVPTSFQEKKVVAEVVSRVLKIKTHYRVLFPES